MFQELTEEVLRIWVAGGPLMMPLAMLGLLIYFALFEIIVYFGINDYYNSNSDEWKHWVEKPVDGHGALGDIIQYAQHDISSMEDVRDRMEEVRSSHLSRINSRIRFAAILVGTAPLTGLLGTVTGMLNTFSGLSNSAAGNTVDLVAGGISEALITTQTGLVLAIPGYIMLNIVKRRRDQMDAFCTQVEIMTLKRFEKGKIGA